MNMLGCFLIFCLLLSTVDAQITISADKSLPRDGETVNLICSIPSFIVPATWSVNTNGVSLTVCRPSGPCLPSNDAARYTYSATASSISVTITSFNSNIDTFGWRCQYGTNSAVYVIKPAVPVTTVQLTNTSGEILTSTINVLKGGITYIRCSTAPSGSRPHATFRWYNRSVNQSPVLIGNQSISSTPDAIMVPGQSEPDLVISYSTLTLIGVTFYQNVYVLCEARDETNTGNYIQSGEVQLNMVYPPVVQLSPNYSMYNVTEGTQNFVFNCNIIEANPLPQSNGYSWFHKSVVMQGQTSSSYTLPSVQKSHDGEYICTVRNEFGNGTSNALALNVQYSPTVSPIISPIKVIQGQPLELVCSADGNPSPQITWNPAGEDEVNRSRLYYSAISRDKAVVHTCTAKNNMVPTMGSLQLGSDSKDLLIDVLYAPVVNPFTSPVKVIQGQPLELVCSADGNPSPQMTWNPAGEDRLNRSRLYYSAISRDKAVIHTCTATNNMVPTMGSLQLGSDSKDLLIDVLYNASISRFTSKDNISVLNENSSLQLLCQVDSNPYAVISLYFENDLKLEMENAMNLNYTITATCLDARKYTCSARNSVMNGDAVSRNIQINVTCQPRSDHRRNISTEHYGSLGDNVTLDVYVIAYPEPTDITWYHREKETDMWQMFPYQYSSSNGLYSSIMIHLATQSDFGYYLVNMSNDIGIYNKIYRILPERQSKFDSPKVSVTGLAVGLSAGIVIILVVGIGIFLWRRYQLKKHNGHDKNTKIEHEESTREKKIKTPSVRQDMGSGREYEGLHFTDIEVTQYQQLSDTAPENHRNPDARSPENDSYEKLHPYVNSDIQMYSSLKIPKTSKDSQKDYENTWIES